MKKFYRVSTPYLDRVEKKYLNIALKNNEISGFFGRYIPEFEKNGLIFSADSDNGKRMEILEIPEHKFYLGVQFHPEFNSRPGFPEEAFSAFVKAAAN